MTTPRGRVNWTHQSFILLNLGLESPLMVYSSRDFDRVRIASSSVSVAELGPPGELDASTLPGE